MGEKPNVIELADKGYFLKENIANAIKNYYRAKLAEHGEIMRANYETQIAFGVSKNVVYKHIR